jgi:hypothetical protein
VGAGSLRARSCEGGATPQRGRGFDLRTSLISRKKVEIYCPRLQPGVRSPTGALGVRPDVHSTMLGVLKRLDQVRALAKLLDGLVE